MMRHYRRIHLQDERAQSLIEYTLLIAFVVLAVAAIMIGMGGTLGGIWQSTNGLLDKAGQSAAPDGTGGNAH